MTRNIRTMATTTLALSPPWLNETSDCVGNSEEDGFGAEVAKLVVDEEGERRAEAELVEDKEEETEEEEEEEDEEEGE